MGIRSWATRAGVFVFALVACQLQHANAQTLDYLTAAQKTVDPALDAHMTVGYETCAKCHAAEAGIWKTTWHHTSFNDLHRRPSAYAIAGRMKLKSIKNNEKCISCHFTPTVQNDVQQTSAAVSCESCHGAGKNWFNNHFPPKEDIQRESPEAKAARISRNLSNGMRNRHNTYTMARICMRCHNVGDEELVNVGGHSIGNPGFELVSSSQGMMRHRFVSGKGIQNAVNTPERLAMMFVSGIIADLEFSLRAVGNATSKEDFGKQVARRAATAAKRLASVQAKVDLPILGEILKQYKSVRLAVNNREPLTTAADQIFELGVQFAAKHSGKDLEAIQAFVPTKERWLYE